MPHPVREGVLRRGAWHIVLVLAKGGDTGPLSIMFPTASAVPPQRRYLWRLLGVFGRSAHLGVLSMPAHAMAAELAPCGVSASSYRVAAWPVGRAVAALMLALTDLRGAVAAIRAGRGRLRQFLAMRATMAAMPHSYSRWIALFDRWHLAPSDADAALPLVLVCHRPEQGDAPLQATLKSLPTQARVLVLQAGRGCDLAADLAAAPERHVAVLQAGEIIAPYALQVMQRVALRDGVAAVYADEDRIDAQGLRSDPLFKPQPSRALLQSGVLTTGLHLFERSLLTGFPQAAWHWAETLRLSVWLGIETGVAVPFVLTHRSPDTPQAPAASLGAIVRAALPAGWCGSIDDRGLPLVATPDTPDPAPRVTLLVPSTGRLAHVPTCLGAVLRDTDYPDFEMVIVLSQPGAITEEQQVNLAPLLTDARVRVVTAPMARFNYARANNLGAAQSSAAVLCLLNDDVSPKEPGWLRVMVGHLQDARVAAVGAKLLYPDNSVQHGGVLLGVGGVADHACRFWPHDAPGMLHRAVLDQELSCVTGACLVLRRSVFDALGGFDEQFATGYNDVDLCLRLREAGHRIIWSAQAVLYHHETISLGSHFSADQAVLERAQADLVWRRHAGQCEADPFHNPNLSRQRHAEQALAFPPRVAAQAMLLGLRSDAD